MTLITRVTTAVGALSLVARMVATNSPSWQARVAAQLLVAGVEGGGVDLLFVGGEGVSGDELLGNFSPQLKLLVSLFTS